MLDEASAARGVHDVYTECESAEHQLRTGVFPEGATRVEEIRGVASGGLSTGSPVMLGGASAVCSVMIRIGAGRLAGNPLWADAWGWAMFKADDPARNAGTS